MTTFLLITISLLFAIAMIGFRCRSWNVNPNAELICRAWQSGDMEAGPLAGGHKP